VRNERPTGDFCSVGVRRTQADGVDLRGGRGADSSRVDQGLMTPFGPYVRALTRLHRISTSRGRMRLPGCREAITRCHRHRRRGRGGPLPTVTAWPGCRHLLRTDSARIRLRQPPADGTQVFMEGRGTPAASRRWFHSDLDRPWRTGRTCGGRAGCSPSGRPLPVPVQAASPRSDAQQDRDVPANDSRIASGYSGFWISMIGLRLRL